jgi:hypothetical protein
MATLDLKDTRRNASKLSHDPNSFCVKLSHKLVLTGWWAHPNCNRVLNCASSSRRFIRQKLQDGKCISSSEFAKKNMCISHQNGYRITRGTQSERRVLHLESCSYNKSHPSPKAYCFSKIDDRKPFLICSNPCLTFLSSACILFTPNQVYPLVRIYHRAILWWFHKHPPLP